MIRPAFDLPEEDLAEQLRIVEGPDVSVADQFTGPWSGCDPDATTREIVGEPDPPPAAGHPGFLALLDEIRALHLKKAVDYGRGKDPLANCRASEEFGIPAWKGVLVRLNDKMHRLKSYCQNGSLANEGVEDSFMDLVAYGLIALVLFREAKS